jgi:hypothetical protein
MPVARTQPANDHRSAARSFVLLAAGGFAPHVPMLGIAPGRPAHECGHAVTTRVEWEARERDATDGEWGSEGCANRDVLK